MVRMKVCGGRKALQLIQVDLMALILPIAIIIIINIYNNTLYLYIIIFEI